jgi:nucleoside-diphosphate-sugar epimerase
MIKKNNMKKILVTGGAGFVGTNLVEFLLKKNDVSIVVFDKLDHHSDPKQAKKITYVKGNIINKTDVINLFKKYGPFEGVYHLAGEMPNKLADAKLMMQTNVDGTSNVISAAVNNKSKFFIFASSNVTYGIPVELPVTEETPLKPLEVYGKSKAEAEKVLEKYKDKINIQMFRCPVITGVGRLGLQAILYEFISENKKVYVLGGGYNKYQFVDVEDVIQAMTKASTVTGFDVYVIGADEVLTLRALYQRVIEFAGSKSKIVSLPWGPALIALSILDKINYSPLGVYQYTMMGRSIYADTTKIKSKLSWKPKKANADTFIENYKWYIKNKGNFVEIGGSEASPNKSIPKMGILKILKKFS